MNSNEKIKEKYRLYVHRKEWKELSETEKKMFEYLVEELNADTMVAPLLATEMYERIIEPELTQQREEAYEQGVYDQAMYWKGEVGEAVRGFIDFLSKNRINIDEASVMSREMEKLVETYLQQEKDKDEQ